MLNPSPPADAVAIIFVAQRTRDDDAGYAAAAVAMEQLAALQPGYLGFVATRGADGLGIAVSYWRDDAAARAWRDHPDHSAIREQGRERWYESYALSVARVERSYVWTKAQP
jgi:heme-degrading monooxygenase HmoA